ncbi:YtxH domain-containing protein [Clostridium sp. CM028]|uniref:YtxH domain-containing protein n=1 Tax=Clostridium TaxID=1485 RepID=UPI0013EE5479|nr:MULTISPECIES: YtxH domain-containing protein [Clostridium]MBU3091849.1 YtxH domain-containing protein [Clostridium sp. CF011]MBW9145365.1 YtxH domain-containing protein [Clostridium sp. CM027]MBW9148820.1 YtxH domain-containing protein [Clostridium sp. CM028]MBZ9606891.1 YtxH domain-containing protein [Clostridium estertheticum]UVE42503.1 YtxH domain-containing protein [Clostridium sp. CM027]
MHNKFISTITAGAIIGVAAGVMLIPNMDRSTKRRAKKAGKVVMNMAGDMYDNVKDYIL